MKLLGHAKDVQFAIGVWLFMCFRLNSLKVNRNIWIRLL